MFVLILVKQIISDCNGLDFKKAKGKKETLATLIYPKLSSSSIRLNVVSSHFLFLNGIDLNVFKIY